jgi:hypothetical protein
MSCYTKAVGKIISLAAIDVMYYYNNKLAAFLG